MQLGVELILGLQVKHLIIEWLLEVNIAIGKKLVNSIARMEASQYAEENENIDMRTVPPSVKRTFTVALCPLLLD